jgi:D-alanyl-D-alanine carboxypeptidase/D-alanyl-D-alanine-endopeptidase (penicillin-binding protein 4)
MRRTSRLVGGAVVVGLLVGGGYALADAHDLVPGPLTTAARAAPPPPFPTAPGAAPLAVSGAVLGALPADAAVPSSQVVAGWVQSLVHDARMGSHTGVQIVDERTGDVLSASGATASYTPASTQKLLTAVAALTDLDPDAGLPTTVVQASSSTIALVGGGDMLLAAGKGSASKVDGRAGLADLAGQVADALELKGRTTVRLELDDTLFSGPALSPTWESGYFSEGFVAPVAPLEVDVARQGPDEYAHRDADPAMSAAQTFAAALRKDGVTVSGIARGQAPDGATRLGRVDSAPLRDVVAYALENSDNTVTEGLGRLVALHAGLPGSFDGATQAVLASVRRLGVDLTGARIVDCSGLGAGSHLSPQQLAALLALIMGGKQPQLTAIVGMLPISGLRGTLSDRFLSTDARGLVRAKTGSLTGVTALAGTLVTHDRRQLLFVVMADRTPPGQWGPRAALDDFVTKLADCGCSGGAG